MSIPVLRAQLSFFMYFWGKGNSALRLHVLYVCLWVWRKAQKTNTSGMPPAEWGLQGWMCVYGSVLAGRGRDPFQNNGTTVECGTAGNILSQTQGSPGVWGGALCGKTFISSIYLFLFLNIKIDDTQCTILLCGWQQNMEACSRLSFDSFHFTPQLN